MTLKKMGKMIEAYNVIAESRGDRKIRFCVTINEYADDITANSYEELIERIKEEYIDEFVDWIKKYDKFEFGQTTSFEIIDKFGWLLKETVYIATTIY